MFMRCVVDIVNRIIYLKWLHLAESTANFMDRFAKAQ